MLTIQLTHLKLLQVYSLSSRSVVHGAVKSDDLTVKYSQQPVAENRGDFEDGNADGVSNVGDDLGIPEVDLELKSEANF